MIPMAWNNLTGITELFPAPGPPCPDAMSGVIDLVNDWLTDIDELAYVQPNGAGNMLDGTAAAATSDWFSEVGTQHFHNNYLGLLNAPLINISSAAPGGRVKAKRLIPKRGEQAPPAPESSGQ